MSDEKTNNEIEKNRGYFNYNSPYFPSKGKYILDAATGAEYPYKVGTFDEKRFFKVVDSSDILESNGRKSYNSKNSNILFYSSPEMYMKHRNVLLDEEIIKGWHDKYNMLYPEGVFDEKAYKMLYQ